MPAHSLFHPPALAPAQSKSGILPLSSRSRRLSLTAPQSGSGVPPLFPRSLPLTAPRRSGILPLSRCLQRLALLALAFAFLTAQTQACGFTWEYSLKDALDSAVLWNRPVVLVFTGSDWSPRSIKLDQEVFSNTAFANWFGDSFSPCNADFPQRRALPDAIIAENTALAMKFNIKHFPTLVALRPDGSEFARLEYNGESVAEMTAIVKEWHAHFDDAPAPKAPKSSEQPAVATSKKLLSS